MINKSLKKMVHGLFSNGLKLEKLRKDDFPEPGPLARKRCHIEEFHTETAKCHILYPRKKDFKKTILYCHGGAYVSGPSLLHWRMLSHLALTGSYRIFMVNYPKAPEHPYPAGLNAVDEIYDGLVKETDSENIIVMGDSAGGGLALALAMKWRDEGKSLPGRLVLLSPWLNIAMDNKETEEQAELDNMLALPGLGEAANYYSQGRDLKDPYLSPLFGDLTGLPRTILMIGTLDILLPDCRDFRKKAETAGLDLTYEEWDQMFHVWMLNSPYLPEANEAVSRILEWLD
jgi:acetyl esterase/lipase